MVCKECCFFSKYYEALEYHQCRPVSRHLQIVKDLSREDCLLEDCKEILSDQASDDPTSDNHELEKKMKKDLTKSNSDLSIGGLESDKEFAEKQCRLQLFPFTPPGRRQIFWKTP